MISIRQGADGSGHQICFARLLLLCLVLTTLGLGLGCSKIRVLRPGVNRECLESLAAANLNKRIAVTDCERLTAQAAEDATPGKLVMSPSCDLGNGITAHYSPDALDSINAVIEIRNGEETLATISPMPKSHMDASRWGVGPTMACNPRLGRVYYGHPVMGYITAFDTTGSVLWSVSIPNFSSMEGDTNLQSVGPVEIFRALNKSRSLLSRLLSSGESVLVEVRTGGKGHSHYLVSNNGTIQKMISMWDGIQYDANDEGWGFVFGGGLGDLGNYVPKYRVRLTAFGPIPSKALH